MRSRLWRRSSNRSRRSTKRQQPSTSASPTRLRPARRSSRSRASCPRRKPRARPLPPAPAEPGSLTEEEGSEIFETAATPEIVEPIGPSIVEQPPAAEPFAWEAGSSQPVTEFAAEPSAEIWPEPIDTQPAETSATLEAAPTFEEEAPEPGDTEPPVDLREEG